MVTGLIVGLACASPAVHIDRQAARWGLQRHLVEGDGYQHVVYLQPGNQEGGLLHIYLEGDGLPWSESNRISADPTPRRAFTLELMQLDPVDSAYLGRPCYHGLSRQDRCSPSVWTTARYGPAVVDSLAAAARRLAEVRRADGFVLVGYSGGGVLAVLLAERLAATEAIVTLAANLDIDAWTDFHGYSRLRGSLNPIQRSPLSPTITQIHVAGGEDTNVPVGIVESYADRQHAAELVVIPAADHVCCWLEIWPSVLDSLADRLE